MIPDDTKVPVLQLLLWWWENHRTLFDSLSTKKWRLGATVHSRSLFLCVLALREGQTDSVLLSQSSQLLEELAEDNGAIDRVLDAQRLSLLLQAGRPSTATALEQSTVQRLAAVPHVCKSQLSSMSGAGRAVGVTKDQISQRRLTTLN